MATGVKPRHEDTTLTRTDLEAIEDAMKQKKFRDLLSDYCEEIRDPANQAQYQKDMVQLEKERGYDVTFINPKGGYVIKTSVAGDRKAFINICSNENVGKPSYKVQEVNGKRGMNWSIPYSIVPPREDFDGKKQRCVIYDIVFHPDTLRMAEVNKQFRGLVNKTAFDALQNTYNIHLDCNNSRFPRSHYKGMITPSVIRKEDPDYKPPTEDECEHLSQEMMDKLYPQKNYAENDNSTNDTVHQQNQKPRKTNKGAPEFSHKSDEGYTIPKYVIKQQKNVDLQEFTYHKDSKQHSAIPSVLIIEINLPLLSSTSDCTLDVEEKLLTLVSEKPAKYKLNIPLPYSVNDLSGSAKFDKTKSKLIVTLPVIRKNLTSDKHSYLKADSGMESEDGSGSQSEEESSNLIVELSSSTSCTETSTTPPSMPKASENSNCFLENSLGYILPAYTHNVLDDIVAFTFHVRNTEPDSVKVKNEGNKVYIKFTSIGSGFVPVHYAAAIIFDENIKFENTSGEAWDNNVILQLELTGVIPQKFQIGLSEDSMTSEYFDMSQITKSKESEECSVNQVEVSEVTPSIEVTNSGRQTNIVVSSNYDEDCDEDDDSPTDEKDIVWTEISTDHNAKSILRKPNDDMRSLSESSAGDVASSMDYNSDSIPDESSLKKTVRFNDVISKQFYRHNSSIEGQKKKNQRKKSKKRNQDRRKSESEAEDDVLASMPKPVLKQRRDSGLADTSDADTDFKNTPDDRSFVTPTESNTNADPQSILNIIDNDEVIEKPEPGIWETKTESKKSEPITCDNIQHKTDLYNPDKLNKGQYLEIMFKNDLIFDLDM
ncbi:PIH1 domain-containing protein 1 [Operophtera brumata]|uniref:Protein kintoun n=1 Tax=Operophtera brumata TaxID=104452 RepID=A0A0L7LJK3_OPEBR|nr:PIH1 domain-containing protein 1 [Operophtera brumata]